MSQRRRGGGHIALIGIRTVFGATLARLTSNSERTATFRNRFDNSESGPVLPSQSGPWSGPLHHLCFTQALVVGISWDSTDTRVAH